MTSQTYTDPGIVIQTLGDIERDLAERQNDYEQAAYDVAAYARDWERRLAEKRLTAEGRDSDARKAQALVDAINVDGLYTTMSLAQATFEAQKSVIKVLEARAMIGMAILKAHGRG